MPATVTFDDEFNTLSLWNGSTGTWSTTFNFSDPAGNGGSLPGNGEQEWYINANYGPTASVHPWAVANGVLTLTAQKTDPSIAGYLGYNSPGLPGMGSYAYTSGLIESNHSFSQTYGYFEMRAQLPSGQGMWPAFWLLPKDGSWPPELDVMEVLGKDPSTLYTTAHTAQTGAHTSSGVGSVVANTSTGYHTYAVDWEPTTITWYFDNKPVYQVATPSDMNKPMYLVANLAVGGNWAGNADATTPFPAQMQIDYIKAWNANPYTYGAETSTGAGQALSATAHAQLTGGGGDDILTGSLAGGETMTGATGHDTFAFATLPWNGDHITDFHVGSDKLDLHALYPSYSGADPIGAGYVTLVQDGHGGYNVLVNPDGHATTAHPYSTFVVDLEGVTDVGLTAANLLVNGAAGQTAANTFSLSNIFQEAATGGGGGSGGGSPPPPAQPPGGPFVGGAAADTLTATLAGGETMTGGGGNDSLTFKTVPWVGDHVTDFVAGQDRLDFSALFAASHYSGTDPIADGYVKLYGDGSGTWVIYDTDGRGSADPWGTSVVHLDGVDPTTLTSAKLFGATAPIVNATPFTLPLSGAPTTTTTFVRVGVLQGGAGNDLLDGHGLYHSMAGGAGDDTYVVYATGDVVTEKAGAGVDTVRSYAPSYVLPANVENGVLSGMFSQGLTGNGSNNDLRSNNAGSSLNGGSGNDILHAGTGPDALTGGAGNDIFEFSKLPVSAGHVTDFTPGVDMLDLRGLFVAADYHGSDPIAEGFLAFQADGQGNTQVLFDPDGSGGPASPTLVTTLDHVVASSLKIGVDWVFG